jgi:hypothetical protein
MNSKNFSVRLGFGLFAIATVATASADPGKVLAKGQAAFTENLGQWDSRALFLSRTAGADLWITQEGAVFDFHRTVAVSKGLRRNPQKTAIQGHVVKMSFVGANPTNVTGESELAGKSNYFLGSDRSHWATGVRSFSQATAENPYEGISVRYMVDQGKPRYDLIVKPGADPSQIGMKIEGADEVHVLPDGNIELRTSLGSVEQRGLTAYQEGPNGRTEVPCRMTINGNTVHFDAGSYDPAKPLIIDPLVASSYLGGASGNDSPASLAEDSSGDAFVVGETYSTNFPVTTGAYQKTNNGGINGTAFVSELNQSESKLIYSTYLGGSGGDGATAVALDTNGNAVVTGFTASTDFPTTSGAFQTTNQAALTGPDTYTVFVTKLNSTGSALTYSTFVGGQQNSSTTAIALDGNGDAYLTGSTFDSAFVTTAGAFQTTNNEVATGGATVFVTELNPTGTAVTYSTFLGGSGDGIGDGDIGTSIAVDGLGNATVAGGTYSADFPTTAGVLQTVNKAAPGETGFVAKVNPTGSALVYGTYVGGSGFNPDPGNNPDGIFGDEIDGLAVDSTGNAFITGSTSSSDFPTTGGAYATTNPEAANNNATNGTVGVGSFVAELNPTGTALVYGTFYGGTGGLDLATSITLDSSEDAIIAGETNSIDLPLTAGAYQSKNLEAANLADTGFVAKFNPAGASLLYGTFLGGSGAGDVVLSVKLNAAGNTVVAGRTTSTDFPVTTGAAETTTASGFVTTLNLTAGGGTAILGITLTPTSIICGNTASGEVTLTNSTNIPTTVTFSSSGPVVFQPSRVTIPAGTTVGAFKIATQNVLSLTHVDFTVTAGASTGSGAITLLPVALSGISVSDGLLLGGSNVNATVKLNSGAVGTVTVDLSSNNAGVTVPPSINIPRGSSSLSFTVNTHPVASNALATITATYNGTTKTCQISLVAPTIQSLVTKPPTVMGSVPSQGIIHLTGNAATGGDTIHLLSNSTFASVPPTVLVEAGASTAVFKITTSPVSATTLATITATDLNSSKTGTVALQSAALSSVVALQPSIQGGSQTAGVVYLTGEAGPNGDIVTLKSSNAVVLVAPSVTVPKDDKEYPFLIATAPVKANANVTITATYMSVAKTITVTVLQPTIKGLGLPTSTVGGTTISGTVSLTGIAVASGDVVYLKSDNPAAKLTTAFVTVPADKSSIGFTITTTKVSAVTTVNITATFGSSTLTVPVSLDPTS